MKEVWQRIKDDRPFSTILFIIIIILFIIALYLNFVVEEPVEEVPLNYGHEFLERI